MNWGVRSYPRHVWSLGWGVVWSAGDLHGVAVARKLRQLRTIYVLSDSTGNLARHMVAAFLTQFPRDELIVRWRTFVTTGEKLDAALEEVRDSVGMVFHAMISQGFKEHVAKACGMIGVPCCDLTGPFVEFVAQASGLTPERLGEQIKQALSDLINKPDVTVMGSQVNSKKYTVTGGVNRPGTFPMVVATSVFDALNAAGGFRDFANRKNILIIRGMKRLRFNYDDFVKGKHPEQNIPLENGDTILVRE